MGDQIVQHFPFFGKLNEHYMNFLLQSTFAFRQSDLFEAVDSTFHMILSNPPYVAEDAEVEPEVSKWEPKAALFAGRDGLDIIRRLIPQALGHLEPGGWLLFEHGYDQGEAARALLVEAGFVDVSTRKDYGGNERVAAGRKTG